MTRSVWSSILFIFCVGLCAGFAHAQAPDTILVNGRIFTGTTAQPYVEALAIRGDRIVAVGTSAEVAALAGPQTKRIDAGGRVVIPGINDAHYHCDAEPRSFQLHFQSMDPTWQEVAYELAAAEAKAPKGILVLGDIGPTALDETLDNAAPAGSINSSAAEMARWLLLQLNRGKFPDREGRLFSEQRSGEMWSAQTILPIGNPPPALAGLRAHFAAYGLGWGLRDYHGRKLIGHSGGLLGFVSRVMLVPEENLGVVILTNAEEGGAFESILFHVLDHYMNVPPADWIDAFKAAEDVQQTSATETMKKQESARAADSKPTLPLEKYAGVYNDAWYGSATIRMESGKLVFTLDHTPKAVADLQFWQYDTFKAHWRDRTIEDAFVTFSLKPDGSIDHFTMAAVSPLADFSFDYQDLFFKPAAPAHPGKN